MPSNPPSWTAVRALFEQVLPLPPPERDAALAAAAGDAALVAEVRSLLAHAETGVAGALNAGTALEVVNSKDRAHPGGERRADFEDRTGQQLGAWRIASLLGRGGMGEVWLAERNDGAYHGQAAIKVLKRGMDSASVLARFAQERQALARLKHPNIAQLLDAGATADGLPYFVMEHVAGRPIDVVAREQPLAARLALFLQLTDAVSYAHRHLLVHRDLKPGNVLVDAEGRVKLLDFGIAKALDPLEAGGDPELTGAGERPFTPHYASPEQVRGEPVSTATDLYSLGVLLYVLLTGQRPYGRHATTPADAARSVLEEEPARPSSLASPQQVLQGDLDNILL
ncbi:MAG: serine/threonine-protein kinase, partial [Rubrivivax sp.]